MITQGAKANLAGDNFEEQVKQFLLDNNFKQLTTEDKKNTSEQLYFIPQYKYKKLYKNKKQEGKMDFYIYINGVEIGCECKHQSSNGSVDEKYPYTILTAAYQYNTQISILVIDGSIIEQLQPDLEDMAKNLYYENIENRSIVYVFKLNQFKEFIRQCLK